MTTIPLDDRFEALLDYVRESRGFDLTSYKRPTLQRRVAKRLQALELPDAERYREFLEANPDEFVELFNTILINVTGFFRDPESWTYVENDVIPRLLEERTSGPLRVWSTGCATGKEAYTVAILLAEALGSERFGQRVKIYATDVDDDALAVGRHASYDAKDVESVPEGLRERYFDRLGNRFVFRNDLRRAVVFGRHDLLQDPPISKIDLLVSRNTLMYFNAETQSRILANFHFALNEKGYLFLGKSEILLTRSNLFTPLDLKRRIFVKVEQGGTRPRPSAAPAEPREATGSAEREEEDADRLREASLDAMPVAQVVVDRAGNLFSANQAARILFALNPRDVGRPLQDLEVSYRPLELRSRIEQAYTDRHPVVARGVELASPAGVRHLDIEVVPLSGPTGAPGGVAVTFLDQTAQRRLEGDLQTSAARMETAYEELQSTIEELETTNEELQSTNEELETTNEELQSTNEELETMNEELQSTNEELETINDELRMRTDDLNLANAFLESVLRSLRAGVAVVDREQRVDVWNEQAEDLWGLRGDEVRGRHLLSLDIGLPVAELQGPIRAALRGESAPEVVLDAVNRRGKPIRCRVTATPLPGQGGDVRGAIVFMEEHDGD